MPFMCFRPVGMPRMEKVIVQNTDTKNSLRLLSISGSTVHFHCSFFQDKVSTTVMCTFILDCTVLHCTVCVFKLFVWFSVGFYIKCVCSALLLVTLLCLAPLCCGYNQLTFLFVMHDFCPAAVCFRS